MIDIFLKTLPFFAIISLGFGAAKTEFFSEEASAYLTKFVFYFALSAMLFRFSANLSFGDLLDVRFISAYLWGTAFVYGLAMAVSFYVGRNIEEAAIEAQCAAIGNVGFLGIPMLALLMGEDAVKSVMLVLAIDLIVFGSLIVIMVTAARDGRVSLAALGNVGLGLIKNPMIASITLGLLWSAFNIPIPGPLNEFVGILGAAATPGALFAIGASLASKSAERFYVSSWLSFCKLVLHPLFVAIGALLLFPVDPYPAAVMIAAASLPVAGNVYILAQHYGVAPHRVSASILISTVCSIVTVSVIIAWVVRLY
ncbi:AEC family transporter [Lentibacter algarum]|uniref:AEC family transporter n=1 Tax=Lentibacter algarum TaxID=576131 RepID=UPI001C0773AE|nr:AEC family transporter [Lentibacter algarum]MBU2981535.1 AEC family transporter [Lentibacter algarum]